MSPYAILNGHEVVPVSMEEWARTHHPPSIRTVAKTADGGITVSTVFLGLNHQYGDGPPLWFETMVFGGPLDEVCERYTTWEEAEAGHREMVRRVTAAVLEQRSQGNPG